MDIDKLEKMQRIATRMVDGLEVYCYEVEDLGAHYSRDKILEG